MENNAPRLTEAAFHILLALAGRDRHGYEIMQVVEAEQGSGARLGTTTLYRTLRGLLNDGLVTELDERPAEDDDQRRRYYRLTPAGRAAARAEMERLRRLLAAAEASSLGSRPRPRLAH